MIDYTQLIAELEQADEGNPHCVLWPRKLDKSGRGRIWHEGKLKLAHRWVWETFKGPIPEGKMLCHICDNPACVNTRHLYVGTHADNMRDMRVRKRSAFQRHPDKMREVARRVGSANTHWKGEGNPRAKLTRGEALKIKDDKRKTKVVAAEYDVARTTIQRIRNGAAWV